MLDLETISRRSASVIARILATGQISAMELTRYYLDKIAEDDDGRIFIATTEKRALAEAQAADQRLKAGQPVSPLDGVPVVWKDLFDMYGERTTAASAVYRNAAPARADADVVFNLTSAGMISLGKVNLTEFAYSGLGLNPHFGTPVNPFGKGAPRVPGGSSSGTAVTIARGFAPCGIGTDTGGSVRIPASFNGLAGYKPSAGRISKSGVFPLSRTLDTVGPIARSVEDCVLLDAALRGLVSSPVKRRSVTRVSIFVPDEIVLDDASPAVVDNFFRSVKALETAGARIARGPTGIFRQVVNLARDYGSLAAADAYAEHHDLVQSDKIDMIDPRVVARIMGGKTMSAYDQVTLQRERKRLIRELNHFVGDGLVAMPTTAITAPEIAPLEQDRNHFNRINMLVLRNTSLGNFLDMPGVALPNGVDGDGMPTSILLSGISGTDEMVLGLALDAESIVRAADQPASMTSVMGEE